MTQKIKNIIFDYGNVIFDIDFKRAQDAFAKLGVADVEKIFGHKAQSELFDNFDTGKISAAEWRAGIRTLVGNPALSDEQIDEAWNSLLIGVPKGNHELLLKIKEQYQTFLLSNNNEVHYKWIIHYLQEEFGLADNSSFFIKDYYSHLMGMRKPHKEIFEYLLNAHQLVPEETLFIDDSPQHLKTAAELGMQTYLMTKPDNLQAYFKNNGLLKSS